VHTHGRTFIIADLKAGVPLRGVPEIAFRAPAAHHQEMRPASHVQARPPPGLGRVAVRSEEAR
jgi:hypothetical protein